MKTIRYICDGHEYRYAEDVDGIGTITNNYGTTLAFLRPNYEYKSYDLIKPIGAVATVPAGHNLVRSFPARARFAIGEYVADTPSHNS